PRSIPPALLEALPIWDLKGAQLVPQMQAGAKPSAGRLRMMCSAFENLAPSKTNATAALLRSYERQGVVLSPHNADHKRDLSNPTDRKSTRLNSSHVSI